MNYAAALPTFLAVVTLALLAFIVVHNQHKLTNRLFAVFAFADSTWLISVFAINFTKLSSYAYAGRFVFAAAVGLMMSTLAFLNAFLGRHYGRRYSTLVYGLGSLLLPITLTTSLIIKAVHVDVAFGKPPSPVYGVLYPCFILYLLMAVVLLINLLSKRRELIERGIITKQQLNTVSIGVALFALTDSLTNLILPAIVGSQWPSHFAPVGSAILAVSFFYAVSRHKLFDVHFFVVRAAAYLTTLFVMAVIFVAPVILLFGHFLNFHPSIGELAVVAFFSVVLLYALQYLRQLFDKTTTRIFFRHYYDPQEVLDRLSNTLVRTSDAEVLRYKTAKILKETLRANSLRYALAINSAEDATFIKGLNSFAGKSTIIDSEGLSEANSSLSDQFKHDDIALAVRLRTTEESLGYILLGYKESGNAYDSQDRRLLALAADEIAISLQNVLRFEEIQHFNVTLQTRIEEATRQLRRTNDRLRELDSTKDDFISMASHQLRTPLTSVKGYISLVLDGDVGSINENQQKLLGQAFRSSEQMVYLISDLLNLSRLNTGKFVIETAPINLSVLVQEEVEQLKEAASARNLQLVYNKPASFPELMLDGTKIRQVIMNFIDNAIYYTPPGGTVTVSLKETPTAVEYTVTDNGIGVPKAVQHRLFSKFYRADNAQKARPDGTGLGLFMAKKVIVAQNGSIIFESQEGKGSTFGFRFNKAKHIVSDKDRHAASTSSTGK